MLEGNLQKPIVKSDGYYIFTGLPEGTYQTVIKSDDYIDVKTEIQLDPGNPLVHVALSPRPSFTFNENATLIRAALRNSAGNPIAGAYIKAILLSEECARARLAQDMARAGETEVILAGFSGKICIEDTFHISERNTQESEFCSISTIIEGMRFYRLKQPLKFNHHRGALFLPVVETRSDDKGEIVIPFRNYRSKQFNVKLEFNFEGNTLFKEVSVKEGTMNYLGAVHM